jgi:hypothetical protein
MGQLRRRKCRLRNHRNLEEGLGKERTTDSLRIRTDGNYSNNRSRTIKNALNKQGKYKLL